MAPRENSPTSSNLTAWQTASLRYSRQDVCATPQTVCPNRDVRPWRLAPGLSLTVIFLLCFADSLRANPSPMDYWTTVNPSVNAHSIHCIAHGNGRYVAVGDCGAVLISDDGQHC